MGVSTARRNLSPSSHRIGRYPGWWNNLHRLPKCGVTLSGVDESAVRNRVHLPLRGQRRLGVLWSHAPLLPVELRHENHTASTNPFILRGTRAAKPYNAELMSNQTQIDQIADRVERLLLRYEELQRTNALLTTQVETLAQERDSLKSRLGAARARVDALLERLPETTSSSKEAS